MTLDSSVSSAKNRLEIVPKAPWWLTVFIISKLPGFLSGLVWLLISIFVFFGVLGAIAGFEEATEEEPGLAYSLVTDDKNTEDAVLVYKLRGPIDTGDGADVGSLNENIYTSVVAEDFELIKKDANIKNVVFHLDTPGGTVFASEVLGDLIQDLLAAKGQEEAVFYYNQLVASGGVYASNKVSNYIVGSPYGQTGSIGVVTYLANVEELAQNIGYEQVVIKSGNSKDFGNPFRSLSQEEREFLQAQVDASYADFLGIIAEGRELSVNAVREQANGFVYRNEVAREAGLLDELGDVSLATGKAAQNASLERYDVLEMEDKSELFSFFNGGSLIKNIRTTLLGEQALLTTSDFIRPGVQYYVDPLYLD